VARPQKDGLDYFPLDVDMDQDDKVALIEAQHGIVGFAVVIKLLMKIYKNGYFYEWTEKEQLLFSKRINVDINGVNVIINDCIKWGLFDGNMLESYKILTSKGVQKRFLEAASRRQKAEISKKYLLLDDEQVNVYKNLIIVDINGNSKEVNDNINPQSKVKESKVKESKEEKRKEESKENSLSDKTFEILKFYEEKTTVNISLQYQLAYGLAELYNLEDIKEAITKSLGCGKKGKVAIDYAKGILKNWVSEGKGDTNGIKQHNKADPSATAELYDFAKFGG
jgi:hypothetical protein